MSQANRLTQQELETYLWGAATILRGLIDAGDYKQYIFPLLFFKRLSDVWDEEYATAYEYSEDDAYAQAMADERFVIPDGAHWNEVRETAREVGRAIQTAMRSIEAANPDRLDGVFGDAPWTNKDRLPDATLKNLLEHFARHTLSLANVPEDELGNGYEFLIKKFADDSGHTAQEFYTNRTVVHLMVQMLAPQPGESIYDPTCGTGGMLISALDEVKRGGGEHRTLRLYGQERNHMTAAIARMNLVLHGVDDFAIARGDTLANPVFTEQDRLRMFNVVLADPPYSIKQWNRELFLADPWGRNMYGVPPQASADLVFVQHIIASMNAKTGRSVTLLPHGFLARESEANVRAKLIGADVIEAVIGLGRKLFYNSGMESCLLVCRSKKHAEKRNKILFIDAADQVVREGKQNFLLAQHRERILEAYQNYETIPGFASVNSIEDVRKNKNSLGIHFYVGNEHDDEESNRSLQAVWENFEGGSEQFWQQMDEVAVILDGLTEGQQ